MRWLASATLGLLAIAACSNVIAPDLTTYAGDYTLRMINDGTLPYAVLQQTDLKLEITADTMSMTTNGVFRDITHYRRTRVTVIDYPADTLNGSWTVRGQTITFTAQSGAIFAGTVGVSSFSIIGSATTSIYRK